MNSRSSYRFIVYGFPITLIAVLIAYFWVDRPLVEWAHTHHLRDLVFLHYAQKIPNTFPLIALFGLSIVGVRSLITKPLYVEWALFYASVSYAIARFYTQLLKIVFARAWPDTWTNNNPSWLNDGVYGFFWNIDSPAYKSFPSGHSMVIFAVAIVIAGFYPKLRWFCGLACALVLAGLISNYYHFLSDMIAGAYLGTAIAFICVDRAKKNPASQM